MKKEILNLLDEKNVDFGRLFKFYSGIKKFTSINLAVLKLVL